MNSPFKVVGSGGKSKQKSYTPQEDADNLRSNSIAYVTDVISEGPIFGLASGGAASIYLDDVPILSASGEENYKGIKFDFRKGTVDQTPSVIGGTSIDTMDPSFSSKKVAALGPTMADKEAAAPKYNVTDLDADAAIVHLSLSSLYMATDKGDVLQTSVEYRIDLSQDNGNTWHVAPVNENWVSFAGSTATDVTGFSIIYDLTCYTPTTGLLDHPYVNRTIISEYSVDGVTWQEFYRQDIMFAFAVDPDSIMSTCGPLRREISKIGLPPSSYRVRHRCESGDVTINVVSEKALVSPGPYFTLRIIGKQTSSFEQTHRVELPGTGPWMLRVVRITDDRTGNAGYPKFQDEMYWTAVTIVKDISLTYRNTATCDFEANAQLFGSTIPSRTYHVLGKIVEIPSNYDPHTRTYTGIWDGTFKTGWSNNPAWVYRDLLLNKRYGLGATLTGDNIDKWALYEAAKYSDELVKSGLKSESGADIMEPRFTFNGVINSREEAFTVLQAVSSVFRSMIYWGNESISFIQDRPRPITKIITPANTVNGEFTYSGTDMKARHTAAYVSWSNPAFLGKKDVEVVEDREAMRLYDVNPIEITAVGTNSQGQAHRIGAWALDTENSEKETLTYKASLDHLDVFPGAIIGVMDPNHNGGHDHGGRIMAISEDGRHVRLDRDVDFSTSSEWKLIVTLPIKFTYWASDLEYEVGAFLKYNGKTYRSLKKIEPGNDDPENNADWQYCSTMDGPLQYIPIVDASGVKRDIELAEAFVVRPELNAVWCMHNKDIVTRTFRVIGIAEESNHIFTVTALEHDPTKYVRIEQGIQLSRPNWYNFPSGPLANLPAFDPLNSEKTMPDIAPFVYSSSANTRDVGIMVSWAACPDVRARYYEVALTRPGSPEVIIGTTLSTFMEIRDVPPANSPYIVRVRARDDTGALYSEWIGTEYYAEGKPYGIVPDNVTGLTWSSSDLSIRLYWQSVTDIDLRDYELRFGGQSWSDARDVTRIFKAKYPNLTIDGSLLPPGTYNVFIKAFDNDGNQSDVAGTLTTPIIIEAPEQPDVSCDVVGEMLTVAWQNCKKTFLVKEYKIEVSWLDSTGVLQKKTMYQAGTSFTARVDWAGTRTYTVQAVDVFGNASAVGSKSLTLTTVPSLTTGALTTTPLTFAIQLNLQYPGKDVYPDLRGCVVWYASVNDRSKAQILTETLDKVVKHGNLSLNASYYYWIQLVNKFGMYGEFFPVLPLAGVYGHTSSDPADYVELMQGVVSESMFTSDLRLRLDATDASVDGVLTQLDDLASLEPRVDRLDKLPMLFAPGIFSPGVVATVKKHVLHHSIALEKSGTTVNELLAKSGEHAAAIRALDAQVSQILSNDWSPGDAYEKEDVVRYDGKVYQCTAAVGPSEVPPPSDTDHWKPHADIFTLIGTVTQEIDELAAEVSTKAEQSSYNALSDRLIQAESAVRQNATEIDLRVAQSEFDAFSGMFVPFWDKDTRYKAGTTVRSGPVAYLCIKDTPTIPAPPVTNTEYWTVDTNFNERFTTSITNITLMQNTIDLHSRAIVGPIALTDAVAQQGVVVKSVADILGLGVRVSEAQIKVDGFAATIDLQTKVIGDVAGRVSEAEIKIDGLASRVYLSATKEDLTEIGHDISHVEADLDATKKELLLKASTSSVTDMSYALSDASISIRNLKDETGQLGAQVTTTATIMKDAIVGTPALSSTVAQPGVVLTDPSQVKGIVPRLSETRHLVAQAYQEISVLQKANGDVEAKVDSVAAVARQNGKDVALAFEHIGALDEANGALKSQILDVSGIVDDQGEYLYFVKQALDTVNLRDGSVQAQITNAANIAKTADGHAVQAQQTIGAGYSPNNTVASRIQELLSILDAQGHEIVSARQAIGVEYTPNNTVAAKIDSLLSISNQQGQQIGAVSQTMNLWQDRDHNPMAAYMLRLTANNVVAGFGVSNNGQFSEFKVEADRFIICQSTGDNAITPFYLGLLPGGGYGMVLKGDIIADGSILANSLNVERLSAITADLGEVTTGKLKAGDLTVAEGGRVVVGNNNVILDSNTNSLIVCPDGGNIPGNDCVVLGPEGLKIYYWDAAHGQFVFHKPVVRVEAGTVESGQTVTLPGLWREVPKVQVSMNTLRAYMPAYKDQEQTWNVRAENLRQYAPGFWCFEAIARLELGGADGTRSVAMTSSTLTNNNYWRSSAIMTPANCTSITLAINMSSVHGTGTAPKYRNRRVSYRVGYASATGATPTEPTAWTATQTVEMGNSFSAAYVNVPVDFGVGGTWLCWVEFTAEDTGAQFDYGAGGFEYQEAVVNGTTVTLSASAGGGSASAVNDSKSGTVVLTAPVFPEGFTMYEVVLSFRHNVTLTKGDSSLIVRAGTSITGDLPSGYGSKSYTGTSVQSFNVYASVNANTTYKGTATIKVYNVVATCRAMKQRLNDPNEVNNFTVDSYTYKLSNATILATGSCNYVATGR